MLLGTDLGGSGPVAPTRASEAHAPPKTETQMATKVITMWPGTGVVNAVEPGQRKVKLTHAPIPEIGWPAMTMEFSAGGGR